MEESTKESTKEFIEEYKYVIFIGIICCLGLIGLFFKDTIIKICNEDFSSRDISNNVNIQFSTCHRSLSYATNHEIYGPAIATWEDVPNWRFYNDEECLSLFQHPDLLPYRETYEAIDIPVAKADMWRISKLFVDGGWWVDADVFLGDSTNLPYPPDPEKMYIQAENSVHVCNMMFYSPAKHPILKTALDLIKDRIATTEKFRPNYICYCTGPGLMTDAVRQTVSGSLPENMNHWPSRHNLFHKYNNYNNYNKLGLLDQKSLFGVAHHGYAGQSKDGWLTMAISDETLNY